MDNLFEEFPKVPFPEEVVTVLHQNPAVRIERILSCGQISPPNFYYDQQEEEWLVLISGSAVLEIETSKECWEKRKLSSGSILFLPKHQRHRVIETSVNPPCLWLCVFMK